MADYTGNWVTPDLARNPSLAFDTVNSKNPSALAPVISHATKGVAVSDAINDHIDGNGSKSFWAKLGAGTVTGLQWLGKPLQEVQKDYKFIHSVYTDHGFLPGFAATLGVIAGGAAGAVAGGGVGAALGADLAATGLRQIMGNIYTDSYAKSEDANYKVSPGRTFSNALSLAADGLGFQAASKAFKNTDKGAGKFLSGVGDLGFDLTADPVSIVGRFGQLMRNGKYLGLDKAGEIQLKYPIMDTIPGVKNFLMERTRVPLTSDQIDMVYKGGQFNAASRTYNRALEDIAQSNAGEIAQKYPSLGTVAAGRLAKIDTPEKVHQFLKTSLYFGELEGTLAGQAMLPSRTLLRATLGSKLVSDKVAEKFGKFAGNVTEVPNKLVEYLRNTDKLPGNLYKTFSGYMPYSVDAETQKLSLTKFRWNAPDAATTVYRIGRFGMGDAAAKEMAGKYAEAVAVNNLPLARAIKNQTIFESFKAAGLPDDNVFVKKVWDEIQKIDTPLVGTQIYGVTPAGTTLGEYISSQGPKIGGLFSHHAQDMFDIPDFMQVKAAMREAGLVSKVLGGADEFIATRYTNKIFKPLALATAGFGLRVAAAELIPTFARFGIINTFKSKLAVNAAKVNYDLTKGEAKHVFSAAMSSLGLDEGILDNALKTGFTTFKKAKAYGLNYAAKMLPEEQLDLATKLVLANNGHFLSEAVSTGHGYDASTAYQNAQAAHYYFQIQKNSPLYRDLPEYTTYAPSDIHFAPRYATNLNQAAKETSQRNIARDAFTEVGKNQKKFSELGAIIPEGNVIGPEFHTSPEFQAFRDTLVTKEYLRMLDAAKGKYKGYDKEIATLTRWTDSISNGSLHTFAADRVDATLGLIMGKDGTFHTAIADNIANGLNTDLNLVKRLDKKSLPAFVSGPMLQPYVNGTGMIEKVVNIGFKKVIDPIVNGLAREPLYMIHVADAYARLAPRVLSGQLLEDQALRIAQTQASYAMLPQIHNTALRSQFAQLSRNFLPFYFAQEQALKRAFNSLKDTSFASPLFSRGMRFYQLAEHALSDPGFVESDENGNRYLYLPGVGEFGKAVQGGLASFGINIQAGLPISAKGSLVSLKSVLPELSTPGVSPVFAITGNIISDIFPATKDIVQGTIGDISFQRGILDTLVPATWAKTALAALTPVDLTNQMGNAVASAMAAAYYHGQVPGPDSNSVDRQAYVDRIKNNARSILLIKTFLNLVSPLAPQVSQEDAGLRDEFWKLVKEKGNFPDALTEFLGKNGDTAISYTVAKTYSNIPGAKYPYIQQTLDFINEHKNLFDPKSGTSSGAFFLIPQDNIKNESDFTIYNELMGMHFRSQRTPAELLKQFYIAQGDQAMSGQIKNHLDILKNAVDPFTKSQERERWSKVMEVQKNLFPIWYEDYTTGSSATNAQTAYNQMIKILSNEKTAPKGPQVDAIKTLITEYQKHSQTLAQYKMLGIQGASAQIEKSNWEDYLIARADEDLRLAPVINSVFKKLG